ncbi:hypothetical protein RD110_14750 [Rhodoferax koreense]|uniref:T6SS Phospholipase effector Tle1-like catalytic domain-containing protein n=1 Tax=Rhodoferax koreensis TaxID=1842727 RepID=A0A1P8JX04_9BURK|nr:DUF2235 domain-containing protein [Rhodoferax koreense]APW38292.1 hypothetical protein RD110_14750 [Rhodoferax koreense]
MSEFKTVLQPASVSCPRPLPSTAAHECEVTLNIGLFFDGTGNNKTFYSQRDTNTNVARLWEAYRNSPDDGFFRHYVSGVGTPFTEIGEAKPPSTGAAFGGGGEARIVYGLLQVINSVHRYLNGDQARFDQKQLAALCSETRVSSNNPDVQNQSALSAEQKILDDLGLSQGLVSAEDGSFFGIARTGERRRFMRKMATELQQQVQARATLPKVKGIYIDVFGFSRGAAQARVFVTWLHDLLLIDSKLFGVDSYVRMLGLFDTVASVGWNAGAGGHRHSAWATASNLRIHQEVKNCVHYVALHELRTNFPCDSVAVGGSLPDKCHEHHCPGAHSDVGGGYGPGEQGKGVRLQRINPQDPESGMRAVPDDQIKLANLPLNEMYQAALKTCEAHESVPWIDLNSEIAKDAGLPARFGLDRLAMVRQSVQQYFELCDVPAGVETFEALRQHGLRYLAWRYQINKSDGFEKLSSVVRAKSLDEAGYRFYLKGQAIFKNQIRLLSNPSPTVDWTAHEEERKAFHSHASEIFKDMKTLEVKSAVGSFFDDWVHDSYAGFIARFYEDSREFTAKVAHRAAEGQGYVRWRGSYAGSDDRLNALLPENMQQGQDQRRTA